MPSKVALAMLILVADTRTGENYGDMSVRIDAIGKASVIWTMRVLIDVANGRVE